MLDPYEISLLGECFLYKDYQDLAKHFRGAWQQPYKYIVLVGKQSSNLNAVFAAAYPSEWNMSAAKDRIVADDALLLHVPEIALFYRKKGYFPSILLVEDVTLHGTELSKLLRSLRDAILEVLYPGNPPAQDVKYYLTMDLAFSVDISIYATDKRDLLLEDIFEQRLVCEKRLYTQEFRSLSQRISCFLQKVDATNAPFPFSYHLSESPICPPGWIAQKWSYRGAEETVFIQSGQGVCVPAVRFRKMEYHSGIYLTSQVLFGQLAADDFAGICRVVQNFLMEKGLDFLSSTLSAPVPQEQRMRTISFLLSALCLRDFVGDAFSLQHIDLDTVVRDIGKEGEEIGRMLGDGELCKELHSTLLDRLNKCAAPILNELIVEDLYDGDCDSENSYVESRMFELIIKSEESVHQLLQSRRLDADIERRSMSPVEDVLSWNHVGFLWEVPKRRPSAARRLACLLTLADSGLASFRFDCTSTTIYPVTKAENLSMATIPRRLSVLIPALSLLDRDAWRMGVPSENATLGFLREQDEYEAGEWLRLVYGCGQTPTGWDFPLLDTRDWDEGKDGTYLSFVKNVELQKRKYLDLAEGYIQRQSGRQPTK